MESPSDFLFGPKPNSSAPTTTSFSMLPNISTPSLPSGFSSKPLSSSSFSNSILTPSNSHGSGFQFSSYPSTCPVTSSVSSASSHSNMFGAMPSSSSWNLSNRSGTRRTACNSPNNVSATSSASVFASTDDNKSGVGKQHPEPQSVSTESHKVRDEITIDDLKASTFTKDPSDKVDEEIKEITKFYLKAPTFTEDPSEFDLKDSIFSPQNSNIIQQILNKHGDIGKESVVKSAATRSMFMHLVADIVNRLSNHTLDTLTVNELEVVKTQLDDAIAVGFRVDWLKQRVEKIVGAFEYRVRLSGLQKLGREIEAAKRSLEEMETRYVEWLKEIDSIEVEMGRDYLCGSKLGAGLL